jgi:sugar lactone lactonase YvrE
VGIVSDARIRGAVLLSVVAAVVAAAPAAAHDGGQEVRVVAAGLDNPRGLAFGPDGGLYIAESGRGGTDCVIPSPEGEGATNCFGTTGAITRVDVWHGGQQRVVEGLPSIASAEGGEASGPSDISFGKRGRGFFTVGLGGDPALREQFPQTAGMAQLYVLRRNGEVRPIADLGAFEAANNPDADQPESAVDTNPNSVDASWHKIAVADAGGNDVLAVSKRKGLSVLGVIPFTTAPAPPGLPVPPGTPLPTQSVPTSVVRGPDGAYYVGQLTGFPFPVGAANVWRIEPGSAPEVYASGFTQITDLAFGRDGSLYVLEIATGTLAGPPTPGALIRVAADGTRSELAPGTLVGPTGLALGHRAAYVSNHGAEAGTGEVVRIPLGDH